MVGGFIQAGCASCCGHAGHRLLQIRSICVYKIKLYLFVMFPSSSYCFIYYNHLYHRHWLFYFNVFNYYYSFLFSDYFFETGEVSPYWLVERIQVQDTLVLPLLKKEYFNSQNWLLLLGCISWLRYMRCKQYDSCLHGHWSFNIYFAATLFDNGSQTKKLQISKS